VPEMEEKANLERVQKEKIRLDQEKKTNGENPNDSLSKMGRNRA